ncbi:unnamed protein product [Paramecium primaurelia]|uniref:Uncharacterized protein n=1 Tax=Paramecium primaurelia TaxID=5886 RepID=A0A8S1P525_PARPR|nr:unnamed protein product [Paramecium primaurelia]
MDPTPQPEVQKEEKKPNQTRGENRKREPKQKQQQVQYVVKGEEDAATEVQNDTQEMRGDKGEKQQKKKQREDRKRPEFDWDKTKITLESRVPELPAHPPQKPNKEEHYKQLDKIDEDIRKQWNHFNDFVKNVKEQQNMARQGNEQKYKNEVKPLGLVIGDKIKLVNEKSSELKKMKSENDEIKDHINQLFNQAQEYRQKMKSLDDPDRIIDELARLKESLQQDKLSANEEKRIVQQIGALERSLPYIEPLQKLEKDQKVLRTKSAAIGKVMSSLYQSIKDLNDEINQYKSDYEKLKDSTKDSVVTKQNPLIDKERQIVEAKVQELKERKEKLKKDYNNQWNKFEDYEDLQNYREWFLKQINRVRRETEKKRKQEEQRRREEARARREADREAEEQAEAEAKAKELENVNPFQYQVDLCETLITYCNKLKPTAAQQQAQQQKQIDVEQVLKSDDWKKEKCTVIKKDTDDDIYNFSQLKSKKKNKQQQQQKQAKEDKKDEKPSILQHDLQTLQFFDTVKVATPFYITELDKVVKSIQERKEYYLNRENWGKKEEQETHTEESKAKKQQKVQNQDEFPALQ